MHSNQLNQFSYNSARFEYINSNQSILWFRFRIKMQHLEPWYHISRLFIFILYKLRKNSRSCQLFQQSLGWNKIWILRHNTGTHISDCVWPIMKIQTHLSIWSDLLCVVYTIIIKIWKNHYEFIMSQISELATFDLKQIDPNHHSSLNLSLIKHGTIWDVSAYIIVKDAYFASPYSFVANNSTSTQIVDTTTYDKNVDTQLRNGNVRRFT